MEENKKNAPRESEIVINITKGTGLDQTSVSINHANSNDVMDAISSLIIALAFHMMDTDQDIQNTNSLSFLLKLAFEVVGEACKRMPAIALNKILTESRGQTQEDAITEAIKNINPEDIERIFKEAKRANTNTSSDKKINNNDRN